MLIGFLFVLAVVVFVTTFGISAEIRIRALETKVGIDHSQSVFDSRFWSNFGSKH